jgi:nucleotide-binding universal stress UspA family protein
MGSHGRRGVAAVLLGSQTQHVLARSRLPVLVVR